MYLKYYTYEALKAFKQSIDKLLELFRQKVKVLMQYFRNVFMSQLLQMNNTCVCSMGET